jgi:hypothetical protein
MSHVDEKRQPEVILDWCLQANARFQLPLAPVFGVPGGGRQSGQNLFLPAGNSR